MAEVELFLSRARVGGAALYLAAAAVAGAVMVTRAPPLAAAGAALATLYAAAAALWLARLARLRGPALIIDDHGLRYPYLDQLVVPWARVRAARALPLRLGIEIVAERPTALLAPLRPGLRLWGRALLLGRARYLLCLPTPLFRAVSRRRVLDHLAARLPPGSVTPPAPLATVEAARRGLLALNLAWLLLLLAVAATQAFYLGDQGSFLLFVVTGAAPVLTIWALMARRPVAGTLALAPNAACLLLVLIGAMGGGLSALGALLFLPPVANLWALLHPATGPRGILRRAPPAAAAWAAVPRVALVLNLGVLTIILYWFLSKGFHLPHASRIVWLGLFAAIAAAGLAALLSGKGPAARAALALNAAAPPLLLLGAHWGWFHDASGETRAFLAVFFATAAANLLEAARR